MKRSETTQETVDFGTINTRPTANTALIAVAVLIVSVAGASCAATVLWQWVMVSP